MTPKQLYQQTIKEKNYHIDSVQLMALEKLDRLYCDPKTLALEKL